MSVATLKDSCSMRSSSFSIAEEDKCSTCEDFWYSCSSYTEKAYWRTTSAKANVVATIKAISRESLFLIFICLNETNHFCTRLLPWMWNLVHIMSPPCKRCQY
ncbi:hypothetical protein CM49_04175 [Paenibacillus sp. P1XP2]|nr:hypothetical protein CM49_04175 [Paenibacillus sp. P1XP2]